MKNLPLLVLSFTLFAGCQTKSDPAYTDRANSSMREQATRRVTEPSPFVGDEEAKFLALFPDRRDIIEKEGVTAPPYSTPVILKRVDPIYPVGAQLTGRNGEAVVTFLVETDGSVRSCRVMRATDDAFAERAVECVKKWKFKPAEKDGVPITTAVTVPISFRLR